MGADVNIREGVAKEVQNLWNKHGYVKASELVEKAKPKSSPAHEGFTWDDTKAANEFRLNEARHWLRVVQIVREPGEDAERLVHVPVILDDDSGLEGEYKPISVVVSIPDEYARARDAVLGQGRAFAAALAELDRAAAERGNSDMTKAISQINRGLNRFEKVLEATV